MYPLILALRYVNSRWVNYVAIIAVALALTVQIVVMAVLDGMLQDMRQRIRDLGEQVTVSAYDNRDFRLGDLPRLRERLRRELPADELLGLTPLIRGYGALENRGCYSPVLIYGIDLAREASLSQLPKHLLDIDLDPRAPAWNGSRPASQDLPGMFAGAQVAERMQLQAGDVVHVSYLRPGSDRVARRRFQLTSIFRSGSILNDRWVVYIPHAVARELFLPPRSRAQPDVTKTICLWLRHPNRAEELRERVQRAAEEVLGTPLRVTTWQARWRTISAGMAYENRLQELILMLMNLSGGFCVFAIITTLVSRRVRDLGLLRCLGARRRGVVAIFLLVGLFIGIAGSLLGLAAGYVLAEPGIFFSDGRPLIDYLHRQIMGEPLYPPRMFLVGGVKPVFGPKVLLYALGASAISVLAALYPALWSGTREPVEALQHG